MTTSLRDDITPSLPLYITTARAATTLTRRQSTSTSLRRPRLTDSRDYCKTHSNYTDTLLQQDDPRLRYRRRLAYVPLGRWYDICTVKCKTGEKRIRKSGRGNRRDGARIPERDGDSTYQGRRQLTTMVQYCLLPVVVETHLVSLTTSDINVVNVTLNYCVESHSNLPLLIVCCIQHTCVKLSEVFPHFAY